MCRFSYSHLAISRRQSDIGLASSGKATAPEFPRQDGSPITTSPLLSVATHRAPLPALRSSITLPRTISCGSVMPSPIVPSTSHLLPASHLVAEPGLPEKQQCLLSGNA